jgi:hypothetical protein
MPTPPTGKRPEVGAVHADFSIHLDQVPDMTATIDGRGWVTLYGQLARWSVLDLTMYVPVGHERDLVAEIVTALGGSHPEMYRSAKALEAHLFDAHHESQSGRPALEELRGFHDEAHKQHRGRPHTHRAER